MFELKSILNLNQSLALTPELKQALKILALDDQELTQLTNDELTTNFALEEREDIADRPFDQWKHQSVQYDSQNWNNIQNAPPSLWESLEEQLIESSFNVLEKEIGARLIQDLDENGYFSGSSQEIATELFIYESWVENVRKRMLFFEPLGCFAKTLNESVRAQALSCERPVNPILLKVLESNLLEASLKDITQVTKEVRCTKKQLSDALLELSRFRRIPVKNLEGNEPVPYVIPHVEVLNVGGTLRVTNLRSFASGFQINKKFTVSPLVKNEHLSLLVKQNTHRAVALLNALNRREQTIVSVVEAIAKYQIAWFVRTQPLSPLTMKQIAQELEIHESTVSRAVANKYLRCERGTFAVRSFFVSQLNSTNEPILSSDAIKNSILTLISKEDPRRPLSDEEIYRIMCESQQFVARRTIAKYRTQLKIPIRSLRRKPY